MGIKNSLQFGADSGKGFRFGQITMCWHYKRKNRTMINFGRVNFCKNSLFLKKTEEDRLTHKNFILGSKNSVFNLSRAIFDLFLKTVGNLRYLHTYKLNWFRNLACSKVVCQFTLMYEEDTLSKFPFDMN